jgi:hypothetical protein
MKVIEVMVVVKIRQGVKVIDVGMYPMQVMQVIQAMLLCKLYMWCYFSEWRSWLQRKKIKLSDRKPKQTFLGDEVSSAHFSYPAKDTMKNNIMNTVAAG